MKRYLFLISLIVFTSSCNRQKEDLEQTITPVTLGSAEELNSAEGQMYSASILPNRQASLAFRVSGFVEEIRQVKGADGRMRPIDIGDLVKRGTVLAQVRVKDYQLQVSQADGQLTQAKETEAGARAQLQQAQAAAIKAAADYQRAEALYQKKSLTKSDYDGAKANYDSTQAQVKAAQAQVQATGGAMNTAQAAAGTAGLGLSDTSLVAPFDGTIAQRSIELGMLVGPSVSAFVLADVSSVKATFGVSDLVVAQLKRGSKMTVFAEAFPNKAFHGFVSALAPVADSSTRSFQVEVTIANQGSILKPGMIVSLDLGAGRKTKPVTVVPLDAVVRDPGGSGKFSVVVLDGEKARHRPVTLGETYGNRIAVTGIEAGTKVVTSGATYVSDGQTVKVVP
jgi:RND family efflux transporter MFP subunit